MIVDYIDTYRSRFGVEPICAVLSQHGVSIAPSTDYERRRRPVTDWSRRTELEDAYLANALVTLWREEWCVYRVLKLWHAARGAGLEIGRDQVARLVRVAGIRGVVRGRHGTITTRSDRGAPRHPDLVGRAWDTPTAIDELWVADFSYVWTLTGFVYVAFVVDVYSRRILGWRVSGSMRTKLVLDAFRQALHTRHRANASRTSRLSLMPSTTGPARSSTGRLPPRSSSSNYTQSINPVLHRLVELAQYTSVAFTAELIDAGIAGSIGTVGDALDDALCESTIGLFKTQAIDDGGPTWTDRSAVEWQVARWVHWYNTRRLHSSIGYRSPIAFEHHQPQAKTTTPMTATDPEVA